MSNQPSYSNIANNTVNIEINKQIKFLLSNLKMKNETFVHRDFHVSNLMKHKKQLATIDTQDALILSLIHI